MIEQNLLYCNKVIFVNIFIFSQVIMFLFKVNYLARLLAISIRRFVSLRKFWERFDSLHIPIFRVVHKFNTLSLSQEDGCPECPEKEGPLKWLSINFEAFCIRPCLVHGHLIVLQQQPYYQKTYIQCFKNIYI